MISHVRGSIPVLAVCAVAVAALTALWAAPRDFRSVRSTISSERGADEQQRELAPARYVGIDGGALVKAARLIPPDATYFVAAPPALGEAALPLTFYWLFPRRHVSSPRQADWIVGYSVDPGAQGVPTTRPVRLAKGIAAAETLP
jgi:hypothetical protein